MSTTEFREKEMKREAVDPIHSQSASTIASSFVASTRRSFSKTILSTAAVLLIGLSLWLAWRQQVAAFDASLREFVLSLERDHD